MTLNLWSFCFSGAGITGMHNPCHFMCWLPTEILCQPFHIIICRTLLSYVLDREQCWVPSSWPCLLEDTLITCQHSLWTFWSQLGNKRQFNHAVSLKQHPPNLYVSVYSASFYKLLNNMLRKCHLSLRCLNHLVIIIKRFSTLNFLKNEAT